MRKEEPVDSNKAGVDSSTLQLHSQHLHQQQQHNQQQQQQDNEQQQVPQQVPQQQQQQEQLSVAPVRPHALAFTHPKAGSMVIASLRQQANPIIKSVPVCLRSLAQQIFECTAHSRQERAVIYPHPLQLLMLVIAAVVHARL